MATLHFMPSSADHVRGLTDLDGAARRNGVDRVRAALDGMHPGMGRWSGWSDGRPIGEIVLDGEYIEPEGTASFLAAALLCSKVSDTRLIGKFAYVEALYAMHLLRTMVGPRQRPSSLLSSAPAGDLNVVCRAVLGVEPTRKMDLYTVPVRQYLKLASGLGRSWKLVNRVVDGGQVSMDQDDLIRLLRDAVTVYIRERVAGMRSIWTAAARTTKSGARAAKISPPEIDVPQDITEWCARGVGSSTGGDEPPCVEQCCDMMDRGENLQHAGRYLVATFHIHGGRDDNEIGERFVGAPDFNRKITIEQIRQIRRRGYSVPSCRWVVSHGLCPGCDATHPTNYKQPSN